LGGAMICWGMGHRHSRLAKKAKMNTIRAVQSQT
jgi:hypothetical protein